MNNRPFRALCLSLSLLYLQAVFAQQTSFLDVKRIRADIELQPAERSVEGELTVEFKVLAEADSAYLDARNMFFEPIGDAPIDYEGRVDKIVFKGPFTAGQEVTRQFRFRAKPKQTLYFFGSQIWSQGQGKYTSHWLPSLDDMNDKIEFDLSFQIPDPDNKLTIVSNGRLVNTAREDGQLFQEFDMIHPMSSYLVAVAVGAFVQQPLVASDSTRIKLYMPAKWESRMEPTYRHSRTIFDFLTAEIGVAYPWQMLYDYLPPEENDGSDTNHASRNSFNYRYQRANTKSTIHFGTNTSQTIHTMPANKSSNKSMMSKLNSLRQRKFNGHLQSRNLKQQAAQ